MIDATQNCIFTIFTISSSSFNPEWLQLSLRRARHLAQGCLQVRLRTLGKAKAQSSIKSMCMFLLNWAWWASAKPWLADTGPVGIEARCKIGQRGCSKASLAWADQRHGNHDLIFDHGLRALWHSNHSTLDIYEFGVGPEETAGSVFAKNLHEHVYNGKTMDLSTDQLII